MSAYMIVLLKLQNPSWLENYVAHVPDILRSFGGEYLAVSQAAHQFEGSLEMPDQVAIFTFPSLDQMKAFMASDAYAPYKSARIAGSSAEILGIES